MYVAGSPQPQPSAFTVLREGRGAGTCRGVPWLRVQTALSLQTTPRCRRLDLRCASGCPPPWAPQQSGTGFSCYAFGAKVPCRAAPSHHPGHDKRLVPKTCESVECTASQAYPWLRTGSCCLGSWSGAAALRPSSARWALAEAYCRPVVAGELHFATSSFDYSLEAAAQVLATSSSPGLHSVECRLRLSSPRFGA